MFQGSLVAIVTPMTVEGQIDYKAFERLIEWQLDNGTEGIVIIGTTGEVPAIGGDERKRLIKLAVSIVDGVKPVIVGTGTNCTQTTIALTQQAWELAADAALLVTPYYNKPTQEGLYAHYTAVAKAVPMPQILYNVPSRTQCDLLPETVVRLSEHEAVVAIKETVSDVARYQKIVAETELALLGGNDEDALELFEHGGKGIISVVANVAPKKFSEMCNAALANDWECARKLEQQLMPLMQALFVESNPIPVKWALHKMNKIQRGIRLPLTWLSAEHEQLLNDAINKEEAACVS